MVPEGWPGHIEKTAMSPFISQASSALFTPSYCGCCSALPYLIFPKKQSLGLLLGTPSTHRTSTGGLSPLSP